MAGRLNGWRRVAALGLVLAVVAMHGLITALLAERMADRRLAAEMPPRIHVRYVREMDLSAAPAPPLRGAPKPVHRPKRKPAAALAAAGPVPTDAPPAPVVHHEPKALPQSTPFITDEGEEALAAVYAMPANSAAFEPADAEPASDEKAFEWPASTRLSYVLNGHYRGEIHGTAQVEWVQVNGRYQVHLDITVGLKIAPLLMRRMTSEGSLSAEGLVPERYDEDSKLAFQDRRRSTILFEPQAIVMPRGRRLARWSGVQDAASQFAQLSYLFSTQPSLLRTGQLIEVPLALPSGVSAWAYEVRASETLFTPFGAVQAWHLKPNRPTRPARANGDLTAEMWFAPSLAYLPARILIRQDDETFIDLVISRKPELAAQ